MTGGHPKRRHDQTGVQPPQEGRPRRAELVEQALWGLPAPRRRAEPERPGVDDQQHSEHRRGEEPDTRLVGQLPRWWPEALLDRQPVAPEPVPQPQLPWEPGAGETCEEDGQAQQALTRPPRRWVRLRGGGQREPARQQGDLPPAQDLPRRFPKQLQAICCRRSEEHTSELQSRENLVCRLLLEKKKKKKYN